MRRIAFPVIVAIIFAAFAFLIFSPAGYGPVDRSLISEMIEFSTDAQSRIADELKKNPHAVLNLNAKELIPDHIGAKTKSGEIIEIAYREISPSGEIKMFTPQLGVMIVMTPSVNDGVVTWSCWGRPSKKVPIFCRK